MTTHELDLDALAALVNDRWKMVEEIKQLGDSEGVIWDDEEMARFEYLRRQISKGDTALANAFPALAARIEAAEAFIRQLSIDTAGTGEYGYKAEWAQAAAFDAWREEAKAFLAKHPSAE